MGLEDDLNNDEQSVHELSELGEVMQSLDSDSEDKNKMSNVDFNTRLNDVEITAMAVCDEFNFMGLFPSDDSGLTRRFKRLNISKDGKGREEKVRIVQGQREQQQGTGIMNKIGGMFQRRE